ncbi:hypothetical protein Tco_0479063 [Tanacetum coccineum]
MLVLRRSLISGSIKLSTVSEQVSTGNEQVSTGNEQVSIVGTKESTSSQDKGQREGKAPMLSEETPKKSREQILQEEASLAEAIRLDTLQKEEVAKQYGRRRIKRWQGNGMHTSVDKNDSEDSDEVGEQEESTTEDKLEKGFWKCLRIMFEEPLSTDFIWSEIGKQKIISWRYYDTCRVHCLNLESMDVYLLSDRKYPLPAEFTMSNQHKDWLVQEQTALGKDFSNPFYG